MRIAKDKKPVWKGYLLYDYNSMTFWKKLNYRDSYKDQWLQVLFGEGRSWIGEMQSIFRAVKLFCCTLSSNRCFPGMYTVSFSMEETCQWFSKVTKLNDPPVGTVKVIHCSRHWPTLRIARHIFFLANLLCVKYHLTLVFGFVFS